MQRSQPAEGTQLVQKRTRLVEVSTKHGEHRTPGGRAVQRSQPIEGTPPVGQRTRSTKVSIEHPTEQ